MFKKISSLKIYGIDNSEIESLVNQHIEEKKN
jgi:hypothetical protein